MSAKIGVVVGSLRKESFNRKMAKVLMKLAPASLSMTIIEIGDLPLYNQDSEEGGAVAPAEWVRFRKEIKACDGILFVTPEYNRSIPGVLKNAIDVGSRPYGQSAWEKKPAAVISVSPSAVGGFGANNHLRQTFVFLDIRAMQQPEAYIGHAGDLFDAAGEITRSDTLSFLQKFIDAFAAWVEFMKNK
jgi:chromate reductase, NAD(P)H dehydrogenase (quinone)